MATIPHDPAQDLKAVLAEHLPWHGARLNFLAQFLLALLKVRSVSLAELATGFGGSARVDSHYKRLQRFFRGFEIDQDALARLLVRLVPVGEDWFRWLQKSSIPFHQRLKRDTRVPNAWNRMMRLDVLCGSLKPGESHLLPGRRPIWGCFVHLAALRLDDGDFLFVASSGAPQAQALDAYADRWQVETLFGCLKTRGFNLEDTHLTDPERLAKLMGLLALAFAWTCRTGKLLHDGPSPIRQKKTFNRPLKSLFRHGLDFLRNIALNLSEKLVEFAWALTVLSCT